MTQQLNRRKFIKNSALLAGGAITIPTIIPACAKGANDKIAIGMIGTGEHGILRNLKNFLDISDQCQVVAVCDVDKSRMLKAKSMVNEAKVGKACKAFSDFRDLLAREDIDGIQISTPDHWHVHQSIMALQAGKDVISEKPTWTIDLGRKLCDVVEKSDRIFATSLEDRSLTPYYRMAQLVRNGHIGEITKMRTGLPGEHSIRITKDTSIQPVPKDFDWEMWLGPAPYSEYSPGKTHFNFRWCDDYSVGSIADWGAHLIDNAQWCIGNEKWGPVEVEGVGSMPQEGYYDTFNKYKLTYRYENGLEFDVHGDSIEIYIEGTDGWLLVEGWNQPLQASNPDLLKMDLSKDKIQLYTAKNEHVNFIECMKSREEPYHPAEDMHRTATIAHMGHIAMKLQRKLQWDPAKEEFINDAEANNMRSREERDPWKLESLMI
ncbi:Gfo/Idh/MocA family oxidoreductase [Draconibacterium sp.]|nr:Gfo/Idh/MocA family oxidoreductase [Draconibacterium sp.]